MKKLLVLAGAMTIVASAYAQQVGGALPRVYDYKATVKTTTAKYATNVKWTDAWGVQQVEPQVCYRIAATVKVTAVLWTDCFCPDFGGNDRYAWADSVFLANSSMFPTTVYHNIPNSLSTDPADEDYVANIVEDTTVPNPALADFSFWNVERWGNPLPNKATKASLNFWMEINATNCPERDIELWNAGQGTAKVRDLANNPEIDSISGGTVGFFEAPYCSASSGCPACSVNNVCAPAWGWVECPIDVLGLEDPITQDPDYGYLFDPSIFNPVAYFQDTAAYGTFTFKYNSTLSKGIKPYTALKDQITYLMGKTFGTSAVLK